MKIKELELQISEKRDELISLKDAIEAGDMDAITKAGELDLAIAKLNEELASIQESAVKAQALVAAIGTPDTPPVEEDINMENGMKSVDFTQLKDARGAISVELKAATDPVTVGTVGETSRVVLDAQPVLGVRDLFGSEQISGNSVTYFVMGATDGTIDTTAQGALKDQISPKYTSKIASLEKVAAFLKESDELLSDAPYLESAVRGRGVYETRLAIEKKLCDAITGADGVQTLTGITIDNILKAKLNVQEVAGYEADAIIINPADYETFLTAKDGSGQYLFGGPAYAPYGNGGYTANPKFWGLNVCTSSKIAQGTAVVGAFKQCASVITKNNEGFRVEVSNSDVDDFQKNMITVRVEERLALAVRVPSAFVKISAS